MQVGLGTTNLPSQSNRVTDWMPLLDAIGTPKFDGALKSFLSMLAGPKGCATLFHDALTDPISNRTCVCKSSSAACTCSAGSFNGPLHWVHFDDGPWHASIAVALADSSQQVALRHLSHQLAGSGAALGAILRKHIESEKALKEKRAGPLSRLDTIQECISECTDLPPRELEVCARILYGISSAGIAVDLAISETTVKTYRKRAYHRLGLGSERELITWYLQARERWTPRALSSH